MTATTIEPAGAAITREAVRALVTANAAKLRAAAEAGANAHQLALDQQDELEAYIATLGDTDAMKFVTLYSEEMSASTQATLDETAAINAQVADLQLQQVAQASKIGIWISIASFFIAVNFLIWIVKRMP